MAITTENKIGYIRRTYDNDVPNFKLIIGKIKRINIGKTKTSVYSDRFYPLEIEELESNTKFIDTSKGLIVVNEPFIINDEDIDYFNEVVRIWNENPPKSIWD